MVVSIVIAAHGRAWAVKHNGGFLAYAKTRGEASSIGQNLVDWMRDRGRAARLVVEERHTFPSGETRPIRETTPSH